jgi:hypothetical protein
VLKMSEKLLIDTQIHESINRWATAHQTEISFC